jgi:cell division protein FtsL
MLSSVLLLYCLLLFIALIIACIASAFERTYDDWKKRQLFAKRKNTDVK